MSDTYVYASDEDGQFYGSFLGEEYPIYYDYSEPDISLSAPVSGYTYELYYYTDDTTYIKYNNGVVLSDTSYRKFSTIVHFPDVIPSGSVVNITVSGSYSGSTSGFDSVYLKLRDSSQTTLAYKSSNFDVSTYQNYYTMCWDGVEIKGDVDRLLWQFCCTPVSSNWGMYVTNVDITVVLQTDQNLSNIDNNVSGILSYIKNLPSNIASSIKGFFDNVVNAVTSVYNAVTALPAQIKESLTSLFDSIVSAVNSIASSVANKFTSIFDGWFSTDSELDSSISDGSDVIADVGSAEDDLISDALDGINGIDFDAGFSTELITALLWLVPFQDKLFNSLGLVKDVIIVALTVGLVTLLLGRGLRVLGNYGGSAGGGNSYHDSGAPRLKD